MSFIIRQDFLFDGKISFKQPKTGYRVAIDPLFLAAFVQSSKITSKTKILDVGTGAGAVSLCLTYRLKEAHILGIDQQTQLIDLASLNAQDNQLEKRLCFESHNLKTYALEKKEFFDIIVTNPPYFDPKTSHRSQNTLKAASHHFNEIDLAFWIQSCFKLLKSKGYLYMIYPTAALPSLLTLLSTEAGEGILLPLWPKKNHPSKRILLRFRKNSKTHLTLLPGMILHEENGDFTHQANEILRNGKGICV